MTSNDHEPAPLATDPAPVRLAVLGDSIAAGQGARERRDTLAPRLVAGLAQRGVTAVSHVFAVSGARSRQLAPQVDAAVAWGPDVVLLVIGANDLTHLEPPEPALAALRDAVRRLRAVDAEVVLAPAPDLSAVAHVPLALRDAVRRASAAYRSRQVALAREEGARVVDGEGITAAQFAADPRLFASDLFHPSSEGYAVIARRLLPEVLAAAST